MTDKLFTKRLRELTDDAIRESLAEISVEFEKRFGPAALTASPPVVERPERAVRIAEALEYEVMSECEGSLWCRLCNTDCGEDGQHHARSCVLFNDADAILALTPERVPFEVERAIYEADPFLRDGVQVEWGDGWLAVNQTEAWMIVKDAAKRVLALSTPVAQGDVREALEDIAAERGRQISVEGWSPEHDDTRHRGDLALAAALYASPIDLYDVHASASGATWSDPWPWFRMNYHGRAQAGDPPTEKVLEGDGRKKHDRRRRLVIAGALIVAEIERLDRATLTKGARDAG